MTWRCAWCGKPHDDHNPPCNSCGYNSFERTADTEERKTVDTGPQYVWRCPNCGRDHVKNTPPCSRCGAPSLEKTNQRYADFEDELDVPSWFDVSKPYLPVIIVITIVIAVFATGIIPLTALPGIGPPAPPDAPGNATESAGIDLTETAVIVHDEFESERTITGESRSYDDHLVAIATYENRRAVTETFTDTSVEPVNPDDFGHDCHNEPIGFLSQPLESSVDDFENESALASAIATELLDSAAGDTIRTGYDAEGLDVHVDPDRSVVVYYVAC